jgi:hypothetical protein
MARKIPGGTAALGRRFDCVVVCAAVLMPTIRSSSVIASVDYQKPARILEVVFKQGRRYSYYGVPESEYRGLLDADSKGAYYNDRIRDRYPYWRRPENEGPIKRGPRRR